MSYCCHDRLLQRVGFVEGMDLPNPSGSSTQ
jgi:hypothetical protein